MSENLRFVGSTGNRRAQIRQAVDGTYSVFTWADFGGNVGLVLWREAHDQTWAEAYDAAHDWLNSAPSAQQED